MFYKNTKKLGILGLTAVLMATTPALANPSNDMMHKNQEQRIVFDQNGDGIITQSELSKGFLGNISNETFASYDLNKNGTLNANEFSKFVQMNQSTIQSNYQAVRDAQLATVKNRAIAAQQQAEMKRQNLENPAKMYLTLDFVVYDRNGDNQIDMKEFEERTKSSETPMFFKKFDKNRDGTLNRKEFRKLVNSDEVKVTKKRITG